MLPKPTETVIFITSNEPWGDVWFSKQHYANELAMLGYTVYFLNAPTHWSPKHFFDNGLQIIPIKENLSVVNYVNPYPLRFAKSLFLKWNDSRNSNKLLALAKGKKYVLWWKFDPFRFVSAPAFDKYNARHLYHITDPFTHIFSDALLAQNADLVVTVLQKSIPHYQQFAKRQVLYIPHGISSEEFKLDANTLASYQQAHQNSILMIGTLNDDYSIDLLIEIATRFADKKLVLVGPDKLRKPSKKSSFDKLCQMPNVVFEGAQKATILKYYIAVAAVCIVPYDFNIEQNKGTPLKVLNYLAHNKPTVTSIATGLDAYMGKGVESAADTQSFLAWIEKAYAGDWQASVAEVQKLLQKVAYPTLIRDILSALYLEEKA